MATAHALPIYEKLSRRLLRIAAAPRRADNPIHFIAGFHRIRLFLDCPLHAWAWPRLNQNEHIPGFDSHQTCFKCSSSRFFDSRHWRSGPIYRSHRES
ncbi:MAG TPA: hypothetical protein VKR52_18200 [Terracidiphilus sp.]|nr:hypothetical protein [Terracidiphilus sp.]